MAEDKRGRTVILTLDEWETIKRIADEDRRTINAQIAVLIANEAARRQSVAA